MTASFSQLCYISYNYVLTECIFLSLNCVQCIRIQRIQQRDCIAVYQLCSHTRTVLNRFTRSNQIDVDRSYFSPNRTRRSTSSSDAHCGQFNVKRRCNNLRCKRILISRTTAENRENKKRPEKGKRIKKV